MPKITAYSPPSGVPVKRMVDKTTGGIDDKGPYGTAVYKVDASDVWDFIRFAAGTPTAVIGGDGTTPTVTVPLPLQFEDLDKLYASKISYELRGPNKPGECGYDFAFVTVDYRIPEFPLIGDDPYMSLNLDFGGNFLQMPDTAYKFSDNTYAKGVGKFVPEVELQLSWFRRPYLPDYKILNAVGRVNSTTFRGCDPELVRFDGCSAQIDRTALGGENWTIQFSFMYRPVSWNMLMHPSGTGFAYVEDANSNKIYDNYDMNDLFQP